MNNNIEQYKNLVEMLRQALLFYGDDENYKEIQAKGFKTMIEIDGGSQARFALKQIDKIEEALNDFSVEGEKGISAEEIFKQLNDLKNTLNT